MKRYLISRVPDATGEVDLTAPLQFYPEKDSDELYEALKEAFPAHKTHKERMREAVIQFHIEERDQEIVTSMSAVSPARENMP